jgi:hypothetical protein
VLYRARNNDPEGTRQAIITACGLGGDDAADLAGSTEDNSLIWKRALSVGRWPDAAIGDALVALSELGVAVAAQGRLQKLLRKTAETMRDNLVSELGFASNEALGRATVGRWLQNTYNLPLTFEDSSLAELAGSPGFALEGLVEAAEQLGVNPTVLNDLIAHERS